MPILSHDAGELRTTLYKYLKRSSHETRHLLGTYINLIGLVLSEEETDPVQSAFVLQFNDNAKKLQ